MPIAFLHHFSTDHVFIGQGLKNYSDPNADDVLHVLAVLIFD